VERTLSRSDACMMLIGVDQYVMEMFDNKEDVIKAKAVEYVDKLNKIYESSILKFAPNDNIYFQIKEIRMLTNFLSGCENKGVVLSEFSKLGTEGFCLAHLLTNRDFGCVIGLANVGGLCRRFGNTGWTVVFKDNTEGTVNTLAHEVGHNFGSDHDGGNSTMYAGCGKSGKQGIMGGKQSGNFSTCSLAAMHAKLQAVLRQENEKHCFENVEKSETNNIKINMVTNDFTGYSVDCPKVIETDCDTDQPDTPDNPEAPDEPVCGDREVEIPLEECDCGLNYEQCDDPCCYPATVSEEDLKLNDTAKPCTRNQKDICLNPNRTFYYFGLLYPLLFIILLILLIALLLWIDWKYGKRILFSHITERKYLQRDSLHVENEEQKTRRLQREREQQTRTEQILNNETEQSKY